MKILFYSKQTLLGILFWAICLPLSSLAQSWVLQGAAINGAAADDRSGSSVSLSSDGTTMAIGAPLNDAGGPNAGQVKVFKRVSGTWTLQGAAINGAAGDYSGTSVSLSSDGTTVAIGAPNNDAGGTDAGQVRVFKLVGSTWTLQGTSINGNMAGDQNGYSVSLSSDGTTVAIGAQYNDAGGYNVGQVQVFKLVGSTWILQGAAINGAASEDYSGWSVSLSSDGTVVAIGAIGNDAGGIDAGHVRVFKLVGSTWTLQGAAINGVAAGDRAGRSISLSSDGTMVAIGALNNDDAGSNAGHTRVFKLVGGTWTLQGAAINGAAAGDLSGCSVSLSGNGAMLAIGARNAAASGTSAGHVRVFKLVSGTWTLQGAAINGKAAGDQSGESVSLSSDGTTVAIGSPFNGDGGTSAGHVRVFSFCNCDPSCSPIPTTAGTYTATTSRTDAGTGITYYCDATGNLLLSTKPVVVGSTTTVPAAAVQVKIGSTAATYYPKWCGGTTAVDKCFMVKTPATGGNVLINRWWHIDAAQVTGTAVSPANQLQITTYFTDTEYTALQSQMTTNSVLPALTSPTGLILYQPLANPVLAKFADPALVKPLTFTKVVNGASVGVNLWQHSTPASGINQATFKVNSIVNSGGIGIF